MLELETLSRRYGDRLAVDAISATLKPGELVGFLGPNGAGKTTTIKMVAGLLVPTAGAVRICGFDVEKSPEEARKRLAYIPDRPYVPERLSARELLHYVGGLYGLDDEVAQKRGMEELERFGLAGREDDLLGNYSHGMRQRVLLASALMRDPELILVDEPMVGLDPQGARLVKRVLREAADAGACVLMSTHTLAVVEELCDRVLVMRAGTLVADGPVSSLQSHLPPRDDGQEWLLEDLLIALTGQSDEVTRATSENASR